MDSSWIGGTTEKSLVGSQSSSTWWLLFSVPLHHPETFDISRLTLITHQQGPVSRPGSPAWLKAGDKAVGFVLLCCFLPSFLSGDTQFFPMEVGAWQRVPFPPACVAL